MLIYVDDILLLGKKQKINETMPVTSKHFKVTQSKINKEVDFLGCLLSKKENGSFVLSRTTYVKKIIDKYGENAPPKLTPLPPSFDPIEGSKERQLDSRYFQEMLGSVGFLRSTRFDVLHATPQLAKWATKPTACMYKAMRHLLGYLKKTQDHARIFHADKELSTNNLVAVVDAAFASVQDETKLRMSTGGHFIYNGPTMLHAVSSTLRQMATSAPEAELYQVLKMTKTLLYLKGLLCDFGEPEVNMVILTDSQSTVGTINNPVSSR